MQNFFCMFHIAMYFMKFSSTLQMPKTLNYITANRLYMEATYKSSLRKVHNSKNKHFNLFKIVIGVFALHLVIGFKTSLISC